MGWSRPFKWRINQVHTVNPPQGLAFWDLKSDPGASPYFFGTVFFVLYISVLFFGTVFFILYFSVLLVCTMHGVLLSYNVLTFVITLGVCLCVFWDSLFTYLNVQCTSSPSMMSICVSKDDLARIISTSYFYQQLLNLFTCLSFMKNVCSDHKRQYCIVFHVLIFFAYKNRSEFFSGHLG